jgi:hypothetical protein
MVEQAPGDVPSRQAEQESFPLWKAELLRVPVTVIVAVLFGFGLVQIAAGLAADITSELDTMLVGRGVASLGASVGLYVAAGYAAGWVRRMASRR